MRIYSMTATFGKLEHATLTLEPGLNIIEAPNEWGKSTWCAFLIAMLYGIETRARTTKAALADKERYAPWSGSPMSGRMDLCWKGRDITIERSTRGRSVFGVFRAYETATGLPVPELTAENCGQILLGVERSVFTRAGFLKLSDLPVTQDESLRRRLNALVTTGDESGAGDTLAQKLKDLKNRCRFNRTGLLPQAEAQREALENKLRELGDLQQQIQRIKARQAELDVHLSKLKNHETALSYTAAREEAGQVTAALEARDNARNHLTELENACAALPSREEAQKALQTLGDLSRQWQSVQMESQMLPQPPVPPEVPGCFSGLSPEEAVSQADGDEKAYKKLKKRSWLPLLIAGLPILAAGIVLLALNISFWPAFAVVGMALMASSAVLLAARRKKAAAIAGRYETADPSQWSATARRYQQAHAAYSAAMAESRELRADCDRRLEELTRKITQAAEGMPLGQAAAKWQDILDTRNACFDARREYQRAVSYAQALQSMAKATQPPEFPDDMTYSPAETARLISDTADQQRQLQLKLGQAIGRMEQIGQEAPLRGQLATLTDRVARLERTYDALELAQNTLSAARAELQRRFAPRISARAQDLFGRLTNHRYDRLTLGEDLSLNAGAEGEDTLRQAQWRSDGTVDQLYLALRLAVAGELTPEAPLVLDDALVRFDDARLKSAMTILREEAEAKQVILFTCQSREHLTRSEKRSDPGRV